MNSATFIKLNVLWSKPLSCHYTSCIAVGGLLKMVNVLAFLLTIHAGYARQADCICSYLLDKMNTHFKIKPWVPNSSV